MRESKYTQKLKELLRKPFFTNAEAKECGIPRHALDHFVKKNVIRRLSPGIFAPVGYEPKVEFQWESLALVAATIPKGVICLISGLCYYDLTDQIMREAWIAVPHGSYSPQRPRTRIIKMRNLVLGKTKIKMGEYNVKIFDRERCVIDAFRYLSIEIALKALQKYLRNKKKKPQLGKLTDYAKILHVDLTPYILAYTT
jgi:predicted transcriptional regulator of viral defense system